MTRMTEKNYAELAEDAYQNRREGATLTLGGNQYKILKHVSNDENGYAGTIYQDVSSRQIIVAHRGTNDAKDAFTDVQMVTHRVNNQAPDALRLVDAANQFAERERQQTGARPEVTTTGHSLGGSLAEYTAFHKGIGGRSFNGFGAVEIEPNMREGQNAGNFKAYYRITDPVGTGGRHYGESIPLATPKDIEVLSQYGDYNNKRGGIDVREPFTPAAVFGLSAHSMGAFIRSEGGNPPTLTQEARQLAQQYDPMADKYRDDVRFVRETLGVVGKGLADTYHTSKEFATEFKNSIGRGLNSVGETYDQMKDSFMDGVRDVRDRLNNLNPFRRSSSIDSGSDMQQFASNPAVQQTLQAFNRSGLDGDKLDPKVVVALASAANEKGLNLNYAALSQNGETAFGIQGRSQDDPAAKMVNVNVRMAQEQPLDTGLQRLAQQNPGAQLAANQDLEQPQRKGPAMA
jgi:hypothetical protein